jgi:hypothetical protein
MRGEMGCGMSILSSLVALAIFGLHLHAAPGSPETGVPFEPLQLLEPARSAVVPTGDVRVRYAPRGASRGFEVSVIVGERSR